MYTVLLPVDSSDHRAAAQAEAVVSLPSHEDVQVTLLHVFERESAAEGPGTDQLSSARLVRERLTSTGIDVETESRHGTPTTAILEVAEEVDADVIVMGGRKRSTLGKLLFGSVSQAVLLETERPVTIAGEAERVEGPD